MVMGAGCMKTPRICVEGGSWSLPESMLYEDENTEDVSRGQVGGDLLQ